jgi:hypothetical protein
MHGAVEVEAKVFVTGKKKKNPSQPFIYTKIIYDVQKHNKKIRKDKDLDRK